MFFEKSAEAGEPASAVNRMKGRCYNADAPARRVTGPMEPASKGMGVSARKAYKPTRFGGVVMDEGCSLKFALLEGKPQ